MRGRSRWTRWVAGGLFLGLIGASLVAPGPLPPLGPFLEPVHGVWGVARQATWPARVTARLPGLTDSVAVLVDDRGVPHIFAASEHDAYLVMGWIVARERLFQIEVTTRAAEGTLTELVGAGALEADRAARALGLAWGAERKLRALDTTSAGYRAVAAYARGVNAYLNRLRPRDYPLEYRLLGRRPRRWEPAHTALLFARMGLTLASDDATRSRLAVQGLVGREAAEALVPRDSPIQEPIQPARRNAPRYDLSPFPPPGAPEPEAARVAQGYPPSPSHLLQRQSWNPPADDDVVGSNNWAVAPARTRAGVALLAGDPHLELTLPSIWYEVHLVVPGRVDVAGVSLPGSPGVVIGFTRDVAWTFTNTGGDVSDLYAETVDDEEAPARYRLDGAWRPLDLRVESYRDPRGRVLAVDTVRYTHRGPMTRRAGSWLSLRWTVHEPSREVDLFLDAAQARSADAWLDVMQPYVAPTQNGLVADRAGTIAIRSSGWYPIRPDSGRGDVVRDGSLSTSDWLGVLPVERYPFARNPAQGFLASANQQPVDPLDNPAYLGADWPSPWRALRINALLRGDSAVTADAMRRYQTDAGSARADAFVPYFLQVGGSAGPKDGGEAGFTRAAALLAEWDRRYTPDNRRAILFELAMAELGRRTWDELAPAGGSGPVFTPKESTLLRLLHHPESGWWDDRGTAEREGRDALLAVSLRAALDTALARYGDPEGDGWVWSRVRNANIHHLLRLEALSALGIPVQGGSSTLAPLSGRGTHGASWRMVVELGPVVRAWATYPGGQSGNPASPWYDDRIPEWSRGELSEVLFPRSAEELPEGRVRARLRFTPQESR